MPMATKNMKIVDANVATSRQPPQCPKKMYVAGFPIAKSKSPVMHNEAYRLLGLPHNFTICETRTLTEETISKLREPDFGGMAVTMPYKLEIMPFLDGITPMAQLLGAANTVIPLDDGRVIGDNTDWIGILNVLRKGIRPEHNFDAARKEPGLVIGAGGAARAGVYALQELGCGVIYVYNRTAEKIADIAASMPDAKVIPIPNLWKESYIHGPPVFVVGTLPASATHKTGQQASTSDNPTIDMPSDIFARPEGGVMLDMAYLPRNTPLIQVAKESGKWSVNPGIYVLIQQAFPQFRYWTGYDAPEDAMTRACLEAYDAEFGRE